MTVKAKVLGGKEVEVKNVRFMKDVRAALKLGDDYQGSKDGAPADDSDEVREGSRVTYSRRTSGGC